MQIELPAEFDPVAAGPRNPYKILWTKEECLSDLRDSRKGKMFRAAGRDAKILSGSAKPDEGAPVSIQIKEELEESPIREKLVQI